VKDFRATLFFRASASSSKILNDKKYIPCSGKFHGKLCFSGQGEKFLIQYIQPVKAITVKFLVREHYTQGTSPP